VSMTQFGRMRRPALVLGVLCLLVLSGCTERSGDSDRVKIVMATSSTEALKPIFLSTIEQFEQEHPEIRVELMEIPGNYYQKVSVMIAGRNPPDVMWMGQSFVEFAMRGAFLDISDRIAAEIDTSEYHPQVLSWYRFGGKQYGVPYGIDLRFIVYNKTAFDEAGLEYPKDGWSLDRFTDCAKKLTIDRDGDGRIDQYGFRGDIGYEPFGAEFVSPDGSKALCNSPGMIEYLQFSLDSIYKWKISPRPEETRQESGDAYSIFRQGKAAMMEFATWSISHLREKCADVDWDVVGMPVANRRAHWASSAAYVIARDTKRPEESWLFFKKLISDEFQLGMSIESLPASRRVAEQLVRENTLKPANLQSILDATDYLYPTPRIANLQEIVEQFGIARQKVTSCYGTSRYVPPKQAMAEAERRINFVIGKYRRDR